MAVKSVPFKDMKGLGEKLKKVRIAAELTAMKIAQRFGTSHTAISNWERGVSEPPLAYLAYLAENFNCDLNWLLLGKESSVSEAQPQSDLEKELLMENRKLRKELEEVRSTPTVSDMGIATSISAEEN